MRKYRRLTPIERYQIKALKDSGLSLRKIAKTLKRQTSSISRELRRNRARRYIPSFAEKLARSRRQGIGPKKRIHSKLQQRIDGYLYKQWSPEQIAKCLKKAKLGISVEAIYRYVYADQKRGGELYLNLRRRRKWRRSHKIVSNFKNIGRRVNQESIDERPKIVERRKRVGDFERDTVLGKKGSPVLLTIVDRTSRLTRMVLLKSLNAELTHKATVKLLKSLTVQTITNDNGPEFALHKKTAGALKAKIYFNHPYSSWERGTNENTNGLIRQYYPKGHDFRLVTNKEIKRIERLLNTRPRKCLGFKTPIEVHKKLSRVLH